MGEDMENKLWSDLETDEQRIEFLESGRAWDTGIIAKVLEPDIISLLKARIALRDAYQLCYHDCMPNDDTLDKWKKVLFPDD